MKNKIIKLTSLLLVALVVSSVFYACKGNEDDISTTTEPASEVIATTAGGEVDLTTSTVSNSIIDDVVKSVLGDDDWDGDYASLSQAQKDDIVEEMYDRGYVARFSGDKLTVVTKEEYETAQKTSTTSGGTTASGVAITTTSPKVTTTAKGVTTTARRGIVPGTTAKNGITTTTKKSSATTTKAGSGGTTASGGATTTSSSSGGDSNVGEGKITKPDVTYLDKYVINVINTGKYTMKMVMNEEGTTIALTQYVDGSNYSLVGVFTYSGLKITTKFISKDGKKYLIIPLLSQYAEVNSDDMGDFFEDDFSDMISIGEIFEEMDSWEYLGVTRITGMNIESYKDNDGTVWKFYFNSSGLQKVEAIADGTTETYNVVVESGLSSNEAFTIPSGYRKTNFEDMFAAITNLDLGT